MTYFKVRGNFEQGVKNLARLASTEGLDDDVLAAAETAAHEVLAAVQEKAEEVGGDWHTYAQQGQVVRTPDNVVLSFPQQVFDLEHGNPEEGVPANRLILNATNEMRKETPEIFTEALAERWQW